MNAFSDVSKWTVVDQHGASEPQQASAHCEGGVLRIRRKVDRVHGWGIFGWQSPTIPLTAGQCYRLSMRVRSDVAATWEARFSEKEGEEPDDFFTAAIVATDGAWAEHVYFFRGKQCKSMAYVLVWPGGSGAIEFSSPEIRPADGDEPAAWVRGILDSVSPCASPKGDEGFGGRVPRTLAKLRGGDAVTVMTYGDSVAFDVGNSPLDILLPAAYPQARVAVHTRGRGGTGWTKLSQPDELDRFVLAHSPDLVVTANVCTSPDEIAANLRAVIDQVRAARETEFMLVTNAILKHPDGAERHERLADEVRRVAGERECELADLREFFRGYETANGLPLTWHQRDAVHMSSAGKALAAWALMRHLALA